MKGTDVDRRNGLRSMPNRLSELVRKLGRGERLAFSIIDNLKGLS